MVVNSNDFIDVAVGLKESQGKTYGDLSMALGVPAPTIMGWMQKRVRIPMDRAVSLMSVLGYKIVFVKKGGCDEGEPKEPVL